MLSLELVSQSCYAQQQESTRCSDDKLKCQFLLDSVALCTVRQATMLSTFGGIVSKLCACHLQSTHAFTIMTPLTFLQRPQSFLPQNRAVAAVLIFGACIVTYSWFDHDGSHRTSLACMHQNESHRSSFHSCMQSTFMLGYDAIDHCSSLDEYSLM